MAQQRAQVTGRPAAPSCRARLIGNVRHCKPQTSNLIDPVLKHHPCAYCGTTLSTRGKGHVFPRSIYPDTLPNVYRITVPECNECKALWEDAEPHFRNVLLSIWDSETALTDTRAERLWRSFDANDGHRRVRELAGMFRPEQVAGTDRTKIYPAEDERFNLILRRIVRGLAHKHGIGTSIPDAQVTCDVMRWLVPPAFEDEITWHTIAPGFITYGYKRFNDQDAHSFWLIRFSKHVLFFGRVGSQSGNA